MSPDAAAPSRTAVGDFRSGYLLAVVVASRISRLAACVAFAVTTAATGSFLGGSASAAPRVDCSDPRSALAVAVQHTLSIPRLVSDFTTNGERTQRVVFLAPDREQLTVYGAHPQSGFGYLRLGTDIYLSQGDGQYTKSVERPDTPFVAQQALAQLNDAVDLAVRRCTSTKTVIGFRLPPALLPQKLVRSGHGEARIGPNGVISDSVSLTLTSGKTRNGTIEFRAGSPSLTIEPPPGQEIVPSPIRGPSTPTTSPA
jgi:hypothetical protein